ncbi:MAG: NAD(P)/FAD-dependent oxidoreductase [Pseudolabrys sp.]|nr:NAD(P)/FAD-dependent oxidoreductase [Pseudolabrys sp.]
MGEKSVIVIGAGIGGLSTACYAQMNGYRTRVLEMHGVPGGVCTAWQRAGYTFDTCIHNLAGSSPSSPFHAIWRELGVVPATAMHRYDELVQVERAEGEPLTLYTDLDRLEFHLKRLPPADSRVIEEFIGTVRRFAVIDIMGLATATPWQRMKTLRHLPLLLKYGRLTLAGYARRFRDPFLRRAFPTLVYDWPDQTMMMLLAFLAGAQKGDLGWPVGGSKVFARRIEQRLLGLGGAIDYHVKVQSIVVDDGHAVGVRLADGRELRADIVVSNANGYTTIFDMLGGRYTSRAIRNYYNAPVDRIEMGIHVSLGINADLSHEPHAIVLPLKRAVSIAGEWRERLYVEPFGFDASLAPPGKTALKVVLATSYRYWQQLAHDPGRYAAEKEQIADTVIDALDRRFPGLRPKIEVIDVATPMTTLRFTGNGQGYRASIGGVAMALVTGRRLSQTLPGLANFYMVGQWAGVPGVSSVAAMGRDVARAICRSDGKAFTTSDSG